MTQCQVFPDVIMSRTSAHVSGLPRESKAWSVYPQVVVLLAPIQILSPGLAILSMSTNQRSFKLFLANQKSSLMYHPH